MPDSVAQQEAPANRVYHYILHIQEHLAPNWSEWFEGLTVPYTASGESHLSGLIPDQSALHGLLARIRDLNLTLISVNRVEKENLPIEEYKVDQSKDKQEEGR